MRLHAGYVDRRSRSADDLFFQFVGFGIKFQAFKLPGQNVHSLMIEVVVDRNVSTRLNGKKPQTILRKSMTVITVFGQPADTGSDNLQFVAFVRECIDLFIYNFALYLSKIH